MVLIECNWPEFRKLYPGFDFTLNEMKELLDTGYVAVAPGDGKVFTVRLEAAQSEAGEMDWSKAKRGVVGG